MRVALVHDYLTQYGGAERVLEALHALWPEAPVYTALYRPDVFPTHWRTWDIRESWLGKLPGARSHHRLLLPLYPAVFATMGRKLRGVDVVLADSSAWAHHTRPGGAVQIAYIHSPARFLWGDETYLAPARIPARLRPALTLTTGPLRWLDRRAARRVDVLVANSETVRRRIAAVWGRDAEVVYPPVALDRAASDSPAPTEPSYVVVSRLVPHKRIDLAVDACMRSGRTLIVAGSGPELAGLQRRAGPSVRFVGSISDAEKARLLRQATALILPGQEDFGITAVEAQAAGRPVVAFRGGGARETVIDGETGVFFDEPTPGSLTAALIRFEQQAWSAEASQKNAAGFSVEAFQDTMRQIVGTVWVDHQRRG